MNRKIPLEKYAQIGFGVAGVTIVVISVVQFDTTRALGVSSQWVDHTTRVIREIAGTQAMVKAAESAARGFALTADPFFLGAVKESVDSANEHERKVRSLTADNVRQQRRLDKYEAMIAQRFQQFAELASTRRSLGLAAAGEVVRICFASAGNGESVQPLR